MAEICLGPFQKHMGIFLDSQPKLISLFLLSESQVSSLKQQFLKSRILTQQYTNLVLAS